MGGKMNFDLTDDQRALIDTVEKFAGSATAKRSSSTDSEAWAAGIAGRWQGMAELGLPGLLVAEADGGIGMTMADAVLVCEALGQSLAQEPFITAAIVAPKLLERCASDQIRSEQLAAVAEGDMRIALAIDESILDFNPKNIAACASKSGSSFALSATKQLVIDGLTATHFVVTAQVDQQGFNAFILAADRPGVTVTPVRSLDGGWLAQVEFDSVEVDMPLLEEKTALEDVIRALDHGIVAVCAEALGLMNRMLALTASYLQTRQQFGKPIGTFQSLQHRFAEMVVATEQSRSATFMAAAALGNEDATARKIDVSAAKAMVCRHGRAVLEGAIQLHGGIGITDEYELSRYVRRMIEIEKSWGDAIDHEARFASLTN